MELDGHTSACEKGERVIELLRRGGRPTFAIYKASTIPKTGCVSSKETGFLYSRHHASLCEKHSDTVITLTCLAMDVKIPVIMERPLALLHSNVREILKDCTRSSFLSLPKNL